MALRETKKLHWGGLSCERTADGSGPRATRVGGASVNSQELRVNEMTGEGGPGEEPR